VFWTDACTGSGPDTPRGEMKRYVGFFFVVAPASSSFVTFPYTRVATQATIPSDGFLFATSTDPSGNTSEPGKCFPVTDDYIFSDKLGS